ncbi:MAG: T9SS type A sorting domain-containing protein, partial [Fidelibacterota bacterium]
GQNYPNPFNSSTIIPYSLRRPAPVKLQVYDVAGRLTRTLCTGNRTAGEHAISWDGRDQCGCSLSSGIYVYALKVGERALISKRSILLK